MEYATDRVRHRPRAYLGLCSCFVLWAIFTLIAALAPSNAAVTHVYLAPLESKLVQLDTTWYQAVEVIVPNAADHKQITSFMFPTEPEMTGDMVDRSDDHKTQAYPQKFEYWDYKLYSNSSVYISYAVQSPCNFYIIQGEDAFSRWQQGDWGAGVVVELYAEHLQLFKFSVKTEDRYFFVWMNPSTQSQLLGTVSFVINEPSYNLAAATESCSGIESCYFTFGRGTRQCILIVASDAIGPATLSMVNYNIYSRSSYYWSIFGTLWFMLCMGLCVGLFYLFLNWRRGNTLPFLQHNPADDSEKPLLSKAPSEPDQQLQ